MSRSVISQSWLVSRMPLPLVMFGREAPPPSHFGSNGRSGALFCGWRVRGVPRPTPGPRRIGAFLTGPPPARRGMSGASRLGSQYLQWQSGCPFARRGMSLHSHRACSKNSFGVRNLVYAPEIRVSIAYKGLSWGEKLTKEVCVCSGVVLRAIQVCEQLVSLGECHQLPCSSDT
jgi:hypothetical protein